MCTSQTNKYKHKNEAYFNNNNNKNKLQCSYFNSIFMFVQYHYASDTMLVLGETDALCTQALEMSMQ